MYNIHLFLICNGLYEIFSGLSYFHLEHRNLVVIITWECHSLILLHDAPYMFSIGPIDMYVKEKNHCLHLAFKSLKNSKHLAACLIITIILQAQICRRVWVYNQETDTSKYIIPDHNHKLLGPPTLALTLRPFDSIAFSTRQHPQSFKFCHLI